MTTRHAHGAGCHIGHPSRFFALALWNPKSCSAGRTGSLFYVSIYPTIEEKNAVVLGVSPDDEKSHRKFKTKYDLPFTLLVDADHAVAEAYGVWGEKSMYGKKYFGIIRSHFVIDEQGRLADVQVKVSPTDSVEKALQMI